MTILGVWIFAAAVWHSGKFTGGTCIVALIAAALVSAFVK